jgi:glycerate 2-kinase
MGRVIVALDKFKGCIDAARATAALTRGLLRSRPELVVRHCPVTDGGDGTLDALVAAGFRRVPVTADGPTGRPVTTGYVARGEVAVVELADVSGLARLPHRRPSAVTALTASTFGTGQVVAAALDAGHRTVVIGLGGSASTDGGAGLVAALGGRLLDAAGHELPAGVEALARLDRVDLERLHPRLRPGAERAELVVACDVDNPLTGPAGAAAVYGPQKGAGPGTVALLDRALTHWADLVAATTGRDLRDLPGSGAAGGLGFGAAALLGARIVPGIAFLLELTGFAAAVRGADLVVVGEGRLDAQSLRGKGPVGVAATARAAGALVVAVAGRCDLTDADARAAGLAAVYELRALEPDPVRSMRRAAELLEAIGKRIGTDVPPEMLRH